MANKIVSWGNFTSSTEAGEVFPDEITVQVQDGFDPAPGRQYVAGSLSIAMGFSVSGVDSIKALGVVAGPV